MRVLAGQAGLQDGSERCSGGLLLTRKPHKPQRQDHGGARQLSRSQFVAALPSSVIKGALRAPPPPPPPCRFATGGAGRLRRGSQYCRGMPGGVSYEGMQAGQQAYAAIEFCSDPEALWAKIESGHWDWLGVKPDGQFVMGKPSVRHGRGSAVLSVGVRGADGSNRVEVRIPRGIAPTVYPFVTADEARAGYRDKIERLNTPDGTSGLHRVRLYVHSAFEADELVVRKMKNYLGGQARQRE